MKVSSKTQSFQFVEGYTGTTASNLPVYCIALHFKPGADDWGVGLVVVANIPNAVRYGHPIQTIRSLYPSRNCSVSDNHKSFLQRHAADTYHIQNNVIDDFTTTTTPAPIHDEEFSCFFFEKDANGDVPGPSVTTAGQAPTMHPPRHHSACSDEPRRGPSAASYGVRMPDGLGLDTLGRQEEFFNAQRTTVERAGRNTGQTYLGDSP
ncbi:hypothetical protein QBC44DRAFT_399578 [Cladorrhinum sp. PSN332]|nr:hypothetical protein QBC44DRAFT_399578 [Cladorrhinum sp. PSN332]